MVKGIDTRNNTRQNEAAIYVGAVASSDLFKHSENLRLSAVLVKTPNE
jgi:hypothetical protein